LPWKARTLWQRNVPEAGFYKIHGSSFQWVLPADVVLSSLFRLADADLDGRLTSSELAAAVTR
jgi:hypothetical protein